MPLNIYYLKIRKHPKQTLWFYHGTDLKTSKFPIYVNHRCDMYSLDFYIDYSAPSDVPGEDTDTICYSLHRDYQP